MANRTPSVIPLLCLLLLTIRCASSPAGEVGHYSGDILLAAFFPIHDRNEFTSSRGVTCGALKEEDSIQFLEAFYFALDEVNADPDLLPGFKLGATILDSCNDENHALEQAVELLRYLILQSKGQAPFQCTDGADPIVPPQFKTYDKIVGVVGGARSAITIHLASLLQIFSLPQVSYLSTSSELSQAERFPYFARTVPSDTNQAKAIIELLRTFKWYYVSVVYGGSFYGTRGFYDLSKAAAEVGVCFAYSAIIDYSKTGWSEKDYKKIASDLIQSSANVVVVFAQGTMSRRLFEAVALLSGDRRLIFVGSDGWSGRDSVTKGLERVLNNTIAVQPLIHTLPTFDTYFRKLGPSDNQRNPWFAEFWEHHFDCHFMHQVPPGGNQSGNGTRDDVGKWEQCTGEESLHFVYDSVLAYAHALHEMHEDICGGDYQGLCPDMQPDALSGEEIMSYLKEVQFTSVTGRNFHFVNGTDGPPNYTIMHFGRNPDTQLEEWYAVGEYRGQAWNIDLLFDADFRERSMDFPESQCSVPCGPGQVKKYVSGDDCCFVCSNCTKWQIVKVLSDGRQFCLDCRLGTQPNAEQLHCVEIELEYSCYDDPWAISVLAMASVGILLTIVVLCIFVTYLDTPVIKASGRELSLVLMAGILLSYGTVFAVVAPPSVPICSISHLLLGLSYTVIYASILTKTSRIARIFADHRGTPNKTRFTSPGSQIVIVGVLVFGECVILAIWMAASPPKVIHTYPTRGQNVLACDNAEGAHSLIPLIYPFLLLLLCAVYVFKTRKTPDGFNETRLIAFTSYTTVVIWLAFTPLYAIVTDSHVRGFILAVALCLTAFLCLACLFIPKVYICLLRPQKNTREAVMARTSSFCSASYIVDSGSPVDD
ncbi:hypothetical protein CAPTEDRAFT_168165 [Capitella teleta]|uniref:G-protein coupled receptors family 3 profile domain-containing protein n=1 Tax=Capitella teleta TaxID=283909 RepID=R7VMA6_CAPTE|nr:hypothetical protein CAPTEDRAFT_168165 [Capitella teleta]|eukprot:ELU18505.1 hypothetical protein CAPTEDRAFT_168165 [Capitella teleta]